ncbi:NAD(P)/FAD-dependent oxidoreductase [Oribacterium sp. WCC10]|uniref:NAD(P)/FAD-dependent oxidoreductase n=1 Tax=Oribacterium sp. WCC10 TaxID=1855343 RepID=UPI0008E151A1|nr:FAD-dependent oxidoreductase [Oribacterium sp. WCC10]SFG34937.1 thioredoxin reductase (NADPH) [Oribacterium sp. WCC10]
MYDIIIVGAGTAGLSAAIYTVRAGKSVLVLEASAYGGQIINTPDIENYPGIAHISGFDFATGLYNQAKDLGAEIKFEKVVGIETDGSEKVIKTSQREYRAKAVILATGARNRSLGLPDEKELVGKGISYCATCDGMFYRNRVVAVSGGGNTAIEDAQFLSNYCAKVYVVHRRDKFRADQKEVERLKAKDNVEFILNSNITKLISDDMGLTAIEVTDKNSNDVKNIEVSGLFVAIGQAPDNSSFENLVKLDEKGYIEAGEDLKTGTDGIYTAGDCRTKSVRQLTTAASDGAVAALAACGYIDSL